ncbi:hypothetical protein Droror1_Dr00015598 [Drosera rotundifolia]
MATEVLRPQDILVERIRTPPASAFHFPRRKNFNNGAAVRPNRIAKPAAAVQRKRSPVNSGQLNPHPPTTASIPRRSSFDDLRSARSPLIGQVTILRRGETLEVRETVKPTPAKKSETRIGSDPGPTTPVNLYAGSAFFVSPSPDSLPLPSFSKKKQMNLVVDDSATRDLRRLLRLD